MHKRLSAFFLMLFCLSLLVSAGTADIDIPYKKFVLDNGLRVIFHEDHKAPIVAVNIWYHVGSKNEKPGRTGFAHLFEHLMFNGSENYNDDYFKAMEKVGATDLNGTTNEDRTNYFQNVPTSAFDVALWMESDRMGHLLGAIDLAKLDEQRGVVQNEKRQYENEPYAVAYELSTHNTFPEGHPYSWTVIGSMEDLEAASLEDAHEWFKTYYGAANAVLSIAGNVDIEEALAKVKKYFGDIPSGPPVAKHQVNIAKRTGTARQTVEDRVPQAEINMVWNVPEWGSAEADYLMLASRILGSGKNSRFYKRLVYQDQIATQAYAYLDSREIAGLFNISARPKPGESLDNVEQALTEEMEKFLTEGPDENELNRVKTQYMARFIRGIERIGGFGGKSDILARNEVFGGAPDFYKTTVERIQNATVEDIHAAVKKWLTDGVYILEIHPFPSYKSQPSQADRTKLPTPADPPQAKFPKPEMETLSNGLDVILVERPSIPVVNLNLVVDAGYAADQFAAPGTASLALNMMDEGTKTRTSLEISEELAMLGANLGTFSSVDVSRVSFSALKSNLDESLDVFADVVLNPSFPEKEFTRLQKQTLARIQQEKASPMSMALRVFPGFLYGKDHAYGNPFTGSGTEVSVSAMTRDDLKKFHKTWFKPGNCDLVIVGDARMEEIKPMLEKLFKSWKKGDVPEKNIGKVEQKAKSEVYVIDRPGSPSSIIFAGHVTLPKANPNEIAIETMNNILGGTFTSRINMNLREDKHWSYGAGSVVIDARGQRPFLAYGIVDGKKTKEAMVEMAKEMTEIVSNRPPTADELNKLKKRQILSLPGLWETNNAVLNSVVEMITFDLPQDYWDTYPGKVKGLNIDQLADAAKKTLNPDKVVWIVVGDKANFEDKLKDMGFETIHIIDADGNPVEK